MIILLLFSISISIGLKQYNMEKYKAIMTTVYFILLLIVSFFISNIYSKNIIPFINNNLEFLMAIIGMFILYTGFRFLLEFKNKKETSYLKSESKKNSLKEKITNNLSLPLLLIGAYFGILINLIYVAPVIWMSVFELGLICSITSFIMIISIYLILSNFLKVKSYIYNETIGIFLILSGIYYLIVYTFIPNFQSSLTDKMSPLTLPEINMMITILIIAVIAIVIGFFIKKSKKLKNLL
ncbi:DUF2162 family putative transporter [Methanobrevibacter cuticularis]|nr:DUF2162 family putative transporter [Methanobrevibacter cuticularis]